MKKNLLNTLSLFLFVFLFSIPSIAQDFKNLDKSPHDIVYFRKNQISPPIIKVLYGRPKKNGREIFGSLVPYDKIWRAGADEATEVRFYQDVQFGDTKVKAGNYVLYTIPGKNEWTLILNSNTDVWGVYDYEARYDVARTTAKVSKAEPIEAFSIGFKEKSKHVNFVLAWDTTRVTVPISF